MSHISKRTLSVVIPLLTLEISKLAEKCREVELRADALSNEYVDEVNELQLTLEQYDGALEEMRYEYEVALADAQRVATRKRLELLHSA